MEFSDADKRAGSLRNLFAPSRWTIAVRSAAVSALVVMVSLALATAILLALLYGSLMSSEDDLAASRVTDIAASLSRGGPAELDADLLSAASPLVAVQVVDSAQRIVRQSPGSADVPLLSPSELGPGLTIGRPGHDPITEGLRITGQTVPTPSGTFTVLVGADSEAPRQTVITAALLLAAAAPLVMVETAFVNYVLVKRSLHSVDAIRSRVAEVSTSDLAGRVPVPPSGDEIAALATTMNEMLERVESGHAAQRRFVGDASHELRSPLAGIVSTLEVIEAHPKLLSYELVVDTLLPQVHRVTALVDDLLLLARADEQELNRRRVPVDLRDAVTSEAARLREETTLNIRDEIDEITVTGDPVGLSRVLRNLVDNAARHARTRIDLRACVRGDDVEISVSDDGPGIPEADRERVFDRFVRLDSDRSRRGGGTGLGLAIVAEIVANHKGTVTIEDRAGGGVRIVVVLPLTTQSESPE